MLPKSREDPIAKDPKMIYPLKKLLLYSLKFLKEMNNPATISPPRTRSPQPLSNTRKNNSLLI